MIVFSAGDLFTSPAQTLVNAVNTAGVMGRGIAHVFKGFYPAMYDRYRDLCLAGRFTVGMLWLYRPPHKWVLNFPTKADWRAPSQPEYIEAGLAKFAATYAEQGITSASFPRLGTGLGGLDWEATVRPLMLHYLDPLPIPIYIHDRDPAPRDDAAVGAWLHSVPAPVPFERFHEDLLALIADTTIFSAGSFAIDFDAHEERHYLVRPDGVRLRLSRAVLSELWQFVRAAGYARPADLPAGLDAHAPYIVALLAHLPYLRAVDLNRPGEMPAPGLHYLPPAADLPPEALSWA